MGASSSGGGGRRRRGSRRISRAPMSEINVTPFVDVMLVLLAIFMVTAPLLTAGVPLDLPKTRAKQLTVGKEPLTISVNAKGEVFLQETKITLDEIEAKLKAMVKGGLDEPIYVRGDKGVGYGLVIQVMARINAAGFEKVSLVTQGEG